MSTNFDSLNPKSKTILLIFILSTIITYFLLIIYFSLKIKTIEQKSAQEKPANYTQTISAKPTPKALSQNPKANNPTPKPSSQSVPTPTSTPTPTPGSNSTPEEEVEENSSETPTPEPTNFPIIHISTPTPTPSLTIQDPSISFFDQVLQYLPFISQKVTKLVISSNPSQSNACPVEFNVVAAITVNKEGTVRYQWYRNNGPEGPEQSIYFHQEGTQTVDHQWTISTSGNYLVELKIIDPTPMTSERQIIQTQCQ